MTCPHDWPCTLLRAETGRADRLGSLDRHRVRHWVGVLFHRSVSRVRRARRRRRGRRGVLRGLDLLHACGSPRVARVHAEGGPLGSGSLVVERGGPIRRHAVLQPQHLRGHAGRALDRAGATGSCGRPTSSARQPSSSQGRSATAWRTGRAAPGRRDREWKMAAVNLAGCVLFGISAIASFIVPSSGSMLDLAAANWTTALGALCFFIGSLLLLRAVGDVLPAIPTTRPHGGMTMPRDTPPSRRMPSARSSSEQLDALASSSATASFSSRPPITSSRNTGCPPSTPCG